MRNIHQAALAVDRLPAGMVATCTVEIRKASNHTPLEHDERKLRALTDPHVWFAYTIGVLLVLDRTGVMLSDVYCGGGPDRALAVWFAKRLDDAGLVAAS
jgi:hypothetical protein